jgi:hypothetical protein
MARKPKPLPDDPEQSKRFIEMAREVGADGSKEELDQTLKKLATSKRTPSPKS